MILAIRPDLVDMQRVPTDDEGRARNRLQALREAGVQTGIWWYADHPTHYQGDASLATTETGERWLEGMAQMLVRAVRAIKSDSEAKHLQDEFFAAVESPST